ncbi:hypothetical protein I552_0659 [Mycobacterium xenopi 3993]|nr:hypothetical protein I552_0659 [Mycobacterium xenopi 3993]
MAFHPDVERFLARGRELGEMLGRVHAAAFEDLRVRRAAPEEPNLIPEIDGYGALTDLWMEGIVGRYRPAQIEQLFMSAMRECYEVLGSGARLPPAPRCPNSTWN